MNLKINIFQFDIKWLAPDQNIQLIKSHADSISKDVDLIVMPEMYLTGFCMDATLSAITEDGEEIEALSTIAKLLNVAFIGSLAIEDNGKYYNRVLLISGEGIIGRYDKQYLYSPSGENEAFSSKYDTNLIQFKGWKLLPQVCYDLRFPENVRQLMPPDLLIYMANWPAPRINHWDTLIKARAIENQCYTIGCNRKGVDGNNWEYPGHSTVIQPSGNVQEEVDSVFTLSLKEMESYRSKYRFLEDKKV